MSSAKKSTSNISNDVFETNIEKLVNMIKTLEVAVTNVDEKLNMIIKRQNDIEDKILFRLEKKTIDITSNTITSSSTNEQDVSTTSSNDTTKIISFKDKRVSPVKKGRKKQNDAPQIFKRGKIIMRVYKDTILLTGETFDRKELIKSYNGKWDATNKGWIVSRDKLDKLKLDLEKYSEQLDYDELNEYLIEPKKVESKPKLNDQSFNTCQIMDDDDDYDDE
jgi:hypothetical protein